MLVLVMLLIWNLILKKRQIIKQIPIINNETKNNLIFYFLDLD